MKSEDFYSEYLEWAAEIRSEEYYVNMMIAWLFAEALVYFDDCIKALEKWSIKNQPVEKIELARHFLKMARTYKAMVDGRMQRFIKEMKESPWGEQYKKNEGID